MRAGKIGSFLSCAVSTKTLSGPFGHNTATKSVQKITIIQQSKTSKSTRNHTPDRNDPQNNPSGPLWQIFNEDECHQSRDEDQIGLLKK